LGRSNLPLGGQIPEGGLTALGRVSRFLLFVAFPCCICIGSGGVCFGSGGACICAGGALCVVRALYRCLCSLLDEHGFVSDVLSRCPCLRGSRLILLQVILLFAFPLAFDRLLEFLLVVSFLFLFSLVTKSCVLSMHSSRGRLRTRCGSRTGGWSLPGVMSD
jgi:hypothetical protein